MNAEHHAYIICTGFLNTLGLEHPLFQQGPLPLAWAYGLESLTFANLSATNLTGTSTHLSAAQPCISRAIFCKPRPGNVRSPSTWYPTAGPGTPCRTMQLELGHVQEHVPESPAKLHFRPQRTHGSHIIVSC